MFFHADLNTHEFPGGVTLNPGSAKQQNIKYTYTHKTHIPITYYALYSVPQNQSIMLSLAYSVKNYAI